LKVEKEAKKVAKTTAAAADEAEARVEAKDAKEAAEAKASLEPKPSGGKAKAAKSESEPAQAALLLLETQFPENFASIQPMKKVYF